MEKIRSAFRCVKGYEWERRIAGGEVFRIAGAGQEVAERDVEEV